MTGTQMRDVRKGLGMTQMQAARRWRVSQPYLSLMERGQRPVPARLARRLVRHEPGLATALPVESPAVALDDLPKWLGTLGYPKFAYLRDSRAVVNPASVVLAALGPDDVPVRVTEALPWVLATFADLDWSWLLKEAKLANLQNRLGYLVTLAREVVQQTGDPAAGQALDHAAAALEEARLVREDTLGRELTEVERRHLREHRPASAVHWNVLTTLRAEDLRYGA